MPCAWCGAQLLRDLKGLYGFEPQKQEWASRMADLPIEARAAAAARPAGQSALEPAVLEDLLTRYRALTTAGLAANLYRRTATVDQARRPFVHGCARSRDQQQRGPLPNSRYATVPAGVRTTCMGAVSTSGPLPDAHPARAAAAQHTASIQLTGNLKLNSAVITRQSIHRLPVVLSSIDRPGARLSIYRWGA